MKASEIIGENLNEAPVGMLKRAGLKLGTMIPGRTGQRMQGALDTAKVANEWQKQYYRYIGRSGQKPTTQNLNAFIKTLGVNPTESRELTNEASLTNAQVDAYFKRLAQRAARGVSGSATSAGTSSTPWYK
jgi:hypothetical protein